MNLRRYAIVMLWACAVTRAGSSEAADIYNNLTQPVSINGNFSDGSVPALSFKTSITDFIIDTVTIPIRNPNLLTSGTISFQIYDATGTGGAPGSTVGSALGSVSIASISGAAYQNVTFSGLNRVLTANTNYYVAVKASGLSSAFFVGATTSTGGIIAGSLGYSISNDGGTTWSAPSNVLHVIGRVSTVPEPSTYVMSALATMAIGVVARRRSARKP